MSSDMATSVSNLLEGSMFVFTVLGCWGNSNIIVATIRFKELQTKCGFLLAILAFCDGTSLLFECWSGIRLLTNTAAMDQKKCFILQVGYIFVENMGVFMNLAVSVDRQLAIQRPMNYRNWNTKQYVLSMATVLFIYGFFYPIWSLIVGVDENIFIDMCNLPTSMPDIVSVYWNYISTGACALTVSCYGVTYYMLYRISPSKLKATPAQIAQQKKIVNTLSINVIGFFVSSVATAVLILCFRTWEADQSIIDTVEIYAAFPGLISFTINYYIYFWRSADYRRCFSRHLKMEAFCMGDTNIKIVVQSTTTGATR